MMTYLENQKCLGKTLKNICNWGESLFLIFEGGVFTVIHSECAEKPMDYFYDEPQFDFMEYPREFLIETGIVEPSELVAMLAARNAEYQRVNEAEERQLYLRLQAKYGGGG